MSLQPSLTSFAYDHIPVSAFVPSLPLPPTLKRAAWRDGKKMFGGGSQGIKRQGKKPALVDGGVIDDGSGATSYGALFKSLEKELDGLYSSLARVSARSAVD